MFSLILYLTLFALCSIFLRCLQKSVSTRFVLISGKCKKTIMRKKSFVFNALICMLPVILLYGWRYGIGTDYFSYEQIYNVLHKAPLFSYIEKHLSDEGAYYVEFGFYLLNRIAPNYRFLLFLESILIFTPILMALMDYSDKMNLGMSIFIYLSLQFIHSMNVVRFTIALSFIVLSYKYIMQNKSGKFIFCILFASLFHKTALICFILYFVKEFHVSAANKIRNFLIMLVIFLFPIISRMALQIVSNFPLFNRYFSVSTYEASKSMKSGGIWLFHILPVIMPIIICANRYIAKTPQNRMLFRIYLMEIPFRMMGLYSSIYIRISRYTQMVEILFIPIILKAIKNKQIKILLTLYYIVWYVFYFIYYAIVGDSGDSIPYVWIFSK